MLWPKNLDNLQKCPIPMKLNFKILNTTQVFLCKMRSPPSFFIATYSFIKFGGDLMIILVKKERGESTGLFM